MDSSHSHFSIAVPDLARAAGSVTLLDVRRAAPRGAEPVQIPGAAWRDPDLLGSWAGDLPRGRLVVAYCVHGHEVSQFVAGSLRARGFNARFLIGGLSAWREAGQLLVPIPTQGDYP